MTNIIKLKKAVTLPEILLATFILAAALLPVIGVMSTSLNATTQDENTQKAVQICQNKLNIALQMPFDTFDIGAATNKTSNNIVFDLSPITEKGVTYTPTMTVEAVTVVYNVPTCDFNEKEQDKHQHELDSNHIVDPNNWGWNDVPYTVNGKVKRYIMNVSWQDVGGPGRPTKTYTLSTLKADIRTN